MVEYNVTALSKLYALSHINWSILVQLRCMVICIVGIRLFLWKLSNITYFQWTNMKWQSISQNHDNELALHAQRCLSFVMTTLALQPWSCSAQVVKESIQNIHNNSLWFFASVCASVTTSPAADKIGPMDDARRSSPCILHTNLSVYPPNGPWPAPMGSWRVFFMNCALFIIFAKHF